MQGWLVFAELPFLQPKWWAAKMASILQILETSSHKYLRGTYCTLGILLKKKQKKKTPKSLLHQVLLSTHGSFSSVHGFAYQWGRAFTVPDICRGRRASQCGHLLQSAGKGAEFSKMVIFKGHGGQDIRTVDDSPQKKHVQKLDLQISLQDCPVIQGLLPPSCSWHCAPLLYPSCTLLMAPPPVRPPPRQHHTC